MNLSRRGFIKLTGATLAASSLDALGFGLSSEALAALVRPFKLAPTARSPAAFSSTASAIAPRTPPPTLCISKAIRIIR